MIWLYNVFKTGYNPVQQDKKCLGKNEVLSILILFVNNVFDVYSFVIEGHLVEWLFQLKVYTSLNIV